VKFMFATTEPEKVLATILSRCQRFDLRRIPVALIVKHLAEIAGKEKVQIEEAALYAIARGAEGGMRDAESALDQLISFCGDKIVESDVLSMFGLTAQGQILSVAQGILNGQAETVLRELEDLTRHGKDLGRLLSDLLSHFRNVLIYQVSKGDTKWLEIPESAAGTIAEHAKQINTDGLTRVMEILTDAEGRLRDAASKKIFLEVALLKAIQARNAVSVESVLKQLQQLRQSGGDATPGKSATPATASASPVTEAPKPQAPSRATAAMEPPAPAPAPAPVTPEPMRTEAATTTSPPVAGGGVNIDELWQNVLEAVGRASPFIKTYLLQAHPISLARNAFTIGFDPEFADQMSLVDIPKNHSLIQTKLQEYGHANVAVKFVLADAPASRQHAVLKETPAPAPRPSPQPSQPAARPAAPAGTAASAPKSKPGPVAMNEDDFKNDPLIKKALEIFKGQIVEIRTGAPT